MYKLPESVQKQENCFGLWKKTVLSKIECLLKENQVPTIIENNPNLVSANLNCQTFTNILILSSILRSIFLLNIPLKQALPNLSVWQFRILVKTIFETKLWNSATTYSHFSLHFLKNGQKIIWIEEKKLFVNKYNWAYKNLVHLEDLWNIRQSYNMKYLL